MNNNLTLSALRNANMARIGQFKNKHGELAHKRSDGSDWSPAMWFVALMGEVGEFAKERVDFEEERITFAEYERRAPKELADIATYLDILATRSLDGEQTASRTNGNPTVPEQMMTVVAVLGMFSELLKKWVRGDTQTSEYAARGAVLMAQFIRESEELAGMFKHSCINDDAFVQAGPADYHYVNRVGVDLGQAIEDKFNEVSDRIGCNIKLHSPR